MLESKFKETRAKMDERCLPKSGKILSIVEIHTILSKRAVNVEGKPVRVTGRLDRHDTETCTAVLVDPRSNKSLLVNTRLVEPFSAKLGGLFQFIGELDAPTGSQDVSLVARVVRCVDGLDLTLYNQAIQAQRQYLKEEPTL